MNILNENKVALKDMPKYVAAQVFIALMEGRAQVWVSHRCVWSDISDQGLIDTHWIYRVIKPREIVAPWEAFEDWVQWIAMVNNGSWYGFERKPHMSGCGWSVNQEHAGRCTLLGGIKIKPGDGDWTQQIQQRPGSEK